MLLARTTTTAKLLVFAILLAGSTLLFSKSVLGQSSASDAKLPLEQKYPFLVDKMREPHFVPFGEGEMPNETITDVVEGADGFVWVSSEAGLVRYGGGSFESISPPSDVEGNRVNIQYLELNPAPDGRLWITNFEGFQIYDSRLESFQKTLTFESELIEFTFADLLHFDESGSWILLTNDNQTVLALADANGDLQQQWALQDAEGADHLYYFAGADSQGNLWFWVEGEQHLLSFDTRELVSRTSQLNLLGSSLSSRYSEAKIAWFGLLTSGQFIAQVGDTVTEIDPVSGTIPDGALAVTNSIIEESYVNDHAITPDGRIWIATTSSGLFEISADFDVFKQHKPADTNPNGLPGYTVTSLLVDRFGTLWLGTFNGVFLVDPKRNAAATFSKANGYLENSDAIEILVQDLQYLWVGHANGVDVIDLETGARRIFSPDSQANFAPSEVSALAQTEDGNIYLGSQFSENLYVFDAEQSSFEVLKVFDDYASSGGILALDSLGDNGLLISKAQEMLHLRDGEYLALESAEPANSSGVVQLNEAEYLIAQLNLGLYVYNVEDKSFKNVTPPSLEGRIVFDADSIDLGVVWVITEAGAYQLDYQDGGFSVLSHVPASLFPSNQYASIVLDQQRDVWIGSQGGAYKLARNHGGNNENDAEFSVSYFGKDQGFPQSTYFVATSVRVGNEFIALGSTGGAIVFKPSWFEPSDKPPEVYLTSLLRFNKAVAVNERFDDRAILTNALFRTSQLDLDHTDSVISFEFSAMHSRTPQTNQLWYQMEGIDPSWNEASTQGLATYTSLPPGDYQFKVRAQSGDGVDVDEPYILNLRVQPAWWLSWQFRLALGLAGLLAIIALFNWRTRFVRDKAAALEWMVETATAGLAEKNEELITAREKAEAAMEARSQFLANMSHEIRTPINGVIGMTSLLENSELSKEQRTYLATVKSSGEALLGIINEILDFSKIEAGELELDNKPFSLEKCVSDAVSTLSPLAADKEIQLVVYYKIDRNIILNADGQRLGQALLNLLSNAVKFTHAGQVIVDVDWLTPPGHSADEQSGVLSLSVIDSGIGISPEKFAGLFDPFTQADASTTRKYGGTGLGLSITKKTIEIMDGELKVESKLDVGSTFSMLLPVSVEPLKVNESLRLLNQEFAAFVENEFERRALSYIIEGEGATVTFFSRVDDLQKYLAENSIEVLFVDNAMEESSKALVAGFLREHQPSVSAIYFSCIANYEESSRQYPAVLRKPLLPNEVLNGLAVLSREPESHNRAAQENLSDDRFSGLNVLIAEDNFVNQMVAKRIVNTLGPDAELADNGAEALNMITEKKYDVVFMDIQMPEMDGIEVTKRLRKEATDSPYIIAMTANVYAEDKERCLDAGMNDFVAKPVRIEDVREALLKAQSALAV